MTVNLALFGAFRDLQSAPTISLELPGPASIAELRLVFVRWLQDNGHAEKAGLVRASAFASAQSLLRDADPIPADGELAILPPVSGG